MGATTKKNLSVIVNDKKKMIHMDCLIEEQSDSLITELAVITGKDPSILMNEAIGDLIRMYQPKTRNHTRTLKLIKF